MLYNVQNPCKRYKYTYEEHHLPRYPRIDIGINTQGTS